MLTASEADLNDVHVLGAFERDVLVVALQTAVATWEYKSSVGAETGDVHAEIVYRMQVNQGNELLSALEGRTVVLADLVIDLG